MDALIQLWDDLLRTAERFPGGIMTWRAQAEGAESLFYRMTKASNKELAEEARSLWSRDYRIRFDSIEDAFINKVRFFHGEG